MNDTSLPSQLRSQWGWIALRGLVAVTFGVTAFVWPEPTLVILTMAWGAYAFLDGVLALVTAFRIQEGRRPLWPLAIVGLLGIVAGVVSLIWPEITAFSVLLLIGAWAIAMGAFQIASAIRIRKFIDNEWLLGFSGVVCMVFGAVMVVYPRVGALAIAWAIGAFALPFGFLLIALALRLRRDATRSAPRASTALQADRRTPHSIT
jgi:uncharacterized membrane protein HdeD (DUF308 family)